MKKGEFLRFLSDYNFVEAGEIILKNDTLNFTYEELKKDKGFVYIWVEYHRGVYTVVYVGKAGRSLKARLNQHKGGFNGGSVTGIKNANLIKEGLSMGKKYLVFARKSPTMLVLNEEIHSESVEEIALIKKLKSKLWNRL